MENKSHITLSRFIEVQSSIRFLQADTKVSTLIDKDANQWKCYLVDAIFSKEEVNLIKVIPISPYSRPNKLIWWCTPIGEFNMKSAYHLITELEERTSG